MTVLPAAVTITIALVPRPDGLAPHAWYFFALFAGVVVGLMTEPLPGPAVSLIGVTLITVLAPWVLFSPGELAAAGFDATDASLAWALSGFSNSTVWLIFGAFTFALGYEKTGLGRRIALVLVRSMGRSVFTLAYAIIAADLLMAPFTPSSTARTAGTVYPVISNLPPLYGSLPNSPTRRRIGSYLMWIALSAGAITNSMFLTAMAPNLLGVELVRKTIGFQITWADWFWAFAPLGALLLVALPWLVYALYPPEITKGGEVSAWAADQVKALGPTSAREKILAGLVLLALLLWMFAANTINPTTTALIVVALMLLTNVVSWDDLLLNKPAWATLVWFATLIALADGLNRTGFVTWFGQSVAGGVADMRPALALVVLTCVVLCGSLFVRQRHGPYGSDSAGNARGWRDGARAECVDARDDAGAVGRDYGTAHPFRRWPQPGVLRERLPPRAGLLAARCGVRLPVFCRLARGWALAAADRLTATLATAPVMQEGRRQRWLPATPLTHCVHVPHSTVELKPASVLAIVTTCTPELVTNAFAMTASPAPVKLLTRCQKQPGVLLFAR